jgi:hypothetical protein
MLVASFLISINVPARVSAQPQVYTILNGANMEVNVLSLVILTTLIPSVITAVIQDKFSKYYNKHGTSALHYRELMTSSTTMCALVCLPDAECAGFDVCPIGDEDRNGNDHICKMRNSSDIERCEADKQNGLASRCESYRRVSI